MESRRERGLRGCLLSSELSWRVMPVGAMDRVLLLLESATRLFWAAENGRIACMSSTVVSLFAGTLP